MQRLEDTNPKFLARFIKHCASFMDSILPETDNRIKDKVMTLEDYVIHRRENGGVRPCFDLLEYVLNIDMPDEVFEDQVFMRIYWAAIDAISWANVGKQVFPR